MSGTRDRNAPNKRARHEQQRRSAYTRRNEESARNRVDADRLPSRVAEK